MVLVLRLLRPGTCERTFGDLLILVWNSHLLETIQQIRTLPDRRSLLSFLHHDFSGLITVKAILFFYNFKPRPRWYQSGNRWSPHFQFWYQSRNQWSLAVTGHANWSSEQLDRLFLYSISGPPDHRSAFLAKPDRDAVFTYVC